MIADAKMLLADTAYPPSLVQRKSIRQLERFAEISIGTIFRIKLSLRKTTKILVIVDRNKKYKFNFKKQIAVLNLKN